MAQQETWYLEGFLGGDHVLRRFAVHHERGLAVGRRETLDLCILDQTVSSLHAELQLRDGVLHVRDLGSSNGTYVNRKRIRGEATLQEGDSLHICRNEFRVGRSHHCAGLDDERTARTAILANALPGELSDDRHFRELLGEHRVRAVFQPICALDGSGESPPTYGYELLGRGNHPRLPETPIELFHIADSMGLAGRLSVLFREVALHEARRLPGKPNLFFNTHASELEGNGLLSGLRRLRRAYPRLALTLEIHEAVLASCATIGELRRQLRDLDIGLAYDDFGAGQGRLVMIADTPPDFLKFDMSLIRGIDHAAPSRQRLLRGLVHSVHDLGIPCVAEGVETAAELRTCTEMGFAYAQGYYLGRPAPASHWLGEDGGERPTLELAHTAPQSGDLSETAVLTRVMLGALD